MRGSQTKPAPRVRHLRLADALERHELERVGVPLVGGMCLGLDDRATPSSTEVEVRIATDIRVDLGEVDTLGHRQEVAEHLGTAEDDGLRRVTRERQRLIRRARDEDSLRAGTPDRA